MSGRIFIDCSITYNVNFVTGIQRVVRNIIERKELISYGLGTQVVPVVYDGESYLSLDYFLKNNSELKLKEKAKAILNNRFKNKKLYDFSKFCYSKLKDINLFIRHKQNMFRSYRNRITFEAGDILLIADSYYNPDYKKQYYPDLINSCKKKGVKVALFVYDIIAITNPEYFDDSMAKELDDYLRYMTCFADCLITISQSERTIIENYLNSLNIKKKVEYFYLGCDFEKNLKIDKDFDIEVEKIKPYFLVVGTLEPRKGHDTVLDAFEELWENGFGYNLVFSGRIGWKVDDLLEKINNSKQLNKKFFVLNDVSDNLLTELYHNSSACICATIREGFGLPLVEAIHFKKPVISSDIDIAKEVGNGYPVYFKSGDAKDLAASIKRLERDMTLCRARSGATNCKTMNYRPLTWDESVKMLCDRIKKWI